MDALTDIWTYGWTGKTLGRRWWAESQSRIVVLSRCLFMANEGKAARLDTAWADSNCVTMESWPTHTDTHTENWGNREAKATRTHPAV